MEAEALAEQSAPERSHRRTQIASDWAKLLWVFVLMSILGLLGETLQHRIAFNEWESRAGLVWGPFSPIYGLAAVLLTIFLEPFSEKGLAPLFVIAALVGGGLEFIASWAMETFWGVVAWSYLEIPFNLAGRTDLFHACIWGALGVCWVRVGLPIVEFLFDKVGTERRGFRMVSGLLAVFMVANIVTTLIAMDRADSRANGIPAQSPMDQYYDTHYPDEFLQDRFENMGGLGIGS